MADKLVRTFGPLYLTGTYTTNVYNNSSALIYDVIYSLHIANTNASGGATVTFRLYLGATGANTGGTELYRDYPVTAASYVDLPFYGGLRMDSTDFLVGGASTTSVLTITGFGKKAVV